jgi:hypothetical protein
MIRAVAIFRNAAIIAHRVDRHPHSSRRQQRRPVHPQLDEHNQK